MIWALVAFAARWVPSGFASLGRSASNPSADTSGPAAIIAPPSRLSGINLERRAERVCNRKPEVVDRYLSVHTILFRGR